MLSKFPEEKIHLDATIDKLNEHLQELDKKVKFYEEEFKESKKLLLAIGNDTRQAIIIALLESDCRGIRVGEITKKHIYLDLPYHII